MGVVAALRFPGHSRGKGESNANYVDNQLSEYFAIQIELGLVDPDNWVSTGPLREQRGPGEKQLRWQSILKVFN